MYAECIKDRFDDKGLKVSNTLGLQNLRTFQGSNLH